MPLDAQTVVASGLVLLAALYLGWRGVNLVLSRSSKGCGDSCSECPAAVTPQTPVVQITPKRS